MKKIIYTLLDKLFDLEDEGKIVLNERYALNLEEPLSKELAGFKLDNNLISLYKELSNGLKIEWIADDENNIRGRMELVKLEHVITDQKGIIYFPGDEGLDICNYYPVDNITVEANCGFYMDPETQEVFKEMYYHYNGTEEISGLDLDFKGYIEMAFEAKVYFYWPTVILDIQCGSECHETKEFKKEMPKLFPDFTWDAFVQKYESLRLSKK